MTVDAIGLETSIGVMVPKNSNESTRSSRAARALTIAESVGRTLLRMILSIVVFCALWQITIKWLNLNSYFAKGPFDIYDFLFNSPYEASNRSVLISAMWITLRDAGLGYAAGTLIALIVAIGVVLRRGISQTVMPVAIALRSVPLVAMTPLLTLIFGQGLLAVTIISGIIVFFPSLVNLVHGLRCAPNASFDLLTAYGASEKDVLFKVRLPYALPSMFAAGRISAPGALLGAVLAEWLATGKGLGALMVTSSSTSAYSMLWSAVVLVTVVSVLIYNIVTAIEHPVVNRYGSPTA